MEDLHILIVDDTDDQVAEIIARLFEDTGGDMCRVSAATGVDDALERIVYDNPDLCLVHDHRGDGATRPIVASLAEAGLKTAVLAIVDPEHLSIEADLTAAGCKGIVPRSDALPAVLRFALRSAKDAKVTQEALRRDKAELVGRLFGLQDDHERYQDQTQQLIWMAEDLSTSKSELERLYGELSLQEQQLHLVLDNLPGGLMYTDNALNIVFASRHIPDMFAIPPEVVEHGRSYIEYAALLARKGALGKGDPVELVAERVESIRHPDGRIMEVYGADGRTYSIQRAAAEGGGTVTTIVDITERKNAENALKEHIRELIAVRKELTQTTEELKRHRSRLEDIVEERTRELTIALENEQAANELQRKFISMVSHEFRTPLAIIDGGSQRILRRIDRIEKDEIQTRVGEFREEVKRMANLIDGTLTSDRLDAGKLELDTQLVDLAALIREVCRRQQKISAAHDISVDLEQLPDTVPGDPKALTQVFTNLLSNAVKYAPVQPEISVTGWRNGDFAYVAVKDRGVGIPADELPNMFTRYFRASTASGIGGTGIGLTVVKQFIEMHHGKIDLDSTLNEGSTFTVGLPIR